MHTGNFDELLEQILAKDSRYQRDAYLFVREALDYTQKMLAKATRETREATREMREGAKEETIRHVSGRELLEGVRSFGLEQFGPMTLTVLNEWGLHRCEDFGEIVFNMVDNNLLAKTKDDTREDFKGGYDFEESFRKPFLPPSQLKATGQPESKSSKA